MTDLNTLITANAIPITVDSHLRLRIWDISDAELSFIVRIIQEDEQGNLINFATEIAPALAPFPNEYLYQLTKGRLITASIIPVIASAFEGLTFAEITLREGSNTDDTRVTALTSGYVSFGTVLTYPLSEPKPTPTLLPGRVTKSVTPSGPAGAWSYASPDNVYEKLIAGSFDLTTDANAANRTVQILYGVDGVTWAIVNARANQAANLTKSYHLWKGPNMPADTTTDLFIPIPESMDDVTLRISCNTLNHQGGDLVENVFLGLRRYVSISS